MPIVDVQNYGAHPDGAGLRELDARQRRHLIGRLRENVLRNLAVRSLIIAGMLTDWCVESGVRDARDLGYPVAPITEACATNGLERHEQSLIGIRGYCRQRTTLALVTEISSFTGKS